MRLPITQRSVGTLALAMIVVAAGCAVGPGGGGGLAVSFTIAGKTFTITLGLLDPFEVSANSEPVRQAADANLFDGTPADTPSGGSLTMDANQVTARPRSIGKGQVAAQGVTGSATVGIYVSSITAADPCQEGANIGSFELTLEDGVVTVVNPALVLSPTALAEIITGSFSICLEVTATVDVILIIDEIGVEFGPAIDGGDGDNVNGFEPGPVDNENGGDGANDNGFEPGPAIDAIQLTTDPANDRWPSWAPASDLIVFVTGRSPAADPASNLGSVRADGSGEGNLVTGPNDGFGVGWSPSWVGSTDLVMLNERVVFHEYMTFDTTTAPFTRTASDGDDEALVRKLFIPGGAGGDAVTVSRDGTQVLWRHSTEGGGGTATIRSAAFDSLTGQDADAFGTVHLTGEGNVFMNGMALTPDGSQMVISLASGDGYDLFLYDVTAVGVQLAQLTDTGQTLGYNNAHPDVSPDGASIAFSRTAPGGASDLFILGIDGSGLTNLTDSDASEGAPSWSPDGDFLAFHRYDTDLGGGIPDNWNIYVMSVERPSGCTSDTDCASGEVCENGACVPAPVGCVDDTDCGPDEVCLGGLCMPLPPGCIDDTDCGSDEVCEDGACVPGAVSGYTLTITIEGMGSVDPSGGTYDPGTPVTLTATAADGWRFERWEGDVTGSDNPVTVTLNADTTITAVFVEGVTSNITFRATYDRLWDTDEQNPGYGILHSAMSGDGNRLVWAIQDYDTGALSILTMNVDGSGQTIIPAPAEADSIWEVTINYDGSRAFFRRWFNLLFKVEGGGITQILDVADVDGLGSIGSIQSTTTGDYVYFLDDESNDNDIWRCSHTGGTAELVVNDTDVILHNGFPASQVADFRISGDGGSLVFTTYAYWGDGGYTSRSELFAQVGGAYTQLTTDGDEHGKGAACISGDGSVIVFYRGLPDYSWYSISPDGSNELNLGPSGFNLGGPKLTFDGSKMFYSDSESGGTVLLNTDGSGRQNIVPEWNITNIAIGATHHHAISDDGTRVSFYTQYGVFPQNAAFYVGYLEDPDIIASAVTDAPLIDSITFSPEAFPRSDPEATLLLLASISDPDGLADVTNAAVDAMIDGIHSSYADVPAYFYHSPRDDGESPDEIAADGVFTSAASPGEMLDTLDAVTIRVSAMDASKTITVTDTVLTITGSD